MGRADAQPPRARGHRRARVPLRRASRRSTASRSASLYRDGVLRARRDARQRRDRRGRHAQPAHDRRDPAARSRTRRRCWRCAARSTCRCRTSPALNERRAEAGESTFMNPRNSAAGTIRQLDPARRRQAAALDLGLRGRRHRRAVASPTTRQALDWLREHGFRVNREIVVLDDEDDVIAQCLEWERRRGELDFEIDGVVVKVDDLELQRRLGSVGRDPRWAVAWKFPPTTAVTRLEKVHWNVGKFGDLHPFAVLEPVRVGGVTVKLATLHNEEDLVRKDIRAGEEVIVRARRRRDPAGRLAGAARRRAQATARRCRGRPSAARSATRRRSSRRTRLHQLPESASARRARGSCSSTSSRAARWTSTGSARSRSRCCRSADLVSNAADIYRLRARAAARARRLRRGVREQPARGDRRLEQRPFARVLFALGIEEVGEVTGRNLAQQLPRHRRADRGLARGDRRRRRVSARRWRRRSPRNCTTSARAR